MTLAGALAAGLLAGFLFLWGLVHYGKGPRPPKPPAVRSVVPGQLVAGKSSPPVPLELAAAGYNRRTRPERPRALEAERAYLRARRKAGDR